MTFWVPTHAPQPLVTLLGSVSTFLSYHARGSPLDVALSWVVSVPGSPSGGVGTSRVKLPPTGTRTMALKPPFPSLCYYSELSRPEAPLRCLNLAVSYLGDALTWRRLFLATPHPGDASSGQSVDFLPWTPQVVPPYVDFDFDVEFDFGQRPGTGRYTSPQS